MSKDEWDIEVGLVSGGRWKYTDLTTPSAEVEMHAGAPIACLNAACDALT